MHRLAATGRLVTLPCRFLSSTVDLTCWKCERELSLSAAKATFTCPCERKVLLPISISNYFTILDSEQKFEVNLKSIRRKYHELQVLLHPDKYTLKPEKEQEIALDNSGLVNKAYNTLTNPYQRGLYMLELNGITINETDNMSSDVEFLEEMMSMNEEISSCTDQDRLHALHETIEDGESQYVSNVNKAFINGDIASAKDGLIRLKYYVNLKQELTKKLPIS